MFELPKYISNSLNILFPRELTIRRFSNQFEDRLKANYQQPQMTGVPDEFEPQVPRLIFGSLHGYSQITVSQVNIVLNVKYSPDKWESDISLGRSYLLERVSLIFDLVELLKVEPSYFGLTTHVNIPSTSDDKKILDHISNLFLKEKNNENNYDLQFKFTKVNEYRFFSNITLQNYRSWKFDQRVFMPVKLPKGEVTIRGISILSDFNDRYSFNENKDYNCTRDIAKEIIELGLKDVEKMIKRISS